MTSLDIVWRGSGDTLCDRLIHSSSITNFSNNSTVCCCKYTLRGRPSPNLACPWSGMPAAHTHTHNEWRHEQGCALMLRQGNTLSLVGQVLPRLEARSSLLSAEFQERQCLCSFVCDITSREQSPEYKRRNTCTLNCVRCCKKIKLLNYWIKLLTRIS